jgi:TM2 domain-containing membrane protein YozV
MNKNPIIAFLLAFFPGGGLMYLGKVLRGLFYTAAVFGIPIMSILAYEMTAIEFFPAFALGGLLMYIVNFIDTTITASKLYNPKNAVPADGQAVEKTPDSERFFTIVLSFVPGLGHFQLGLVYRGMTLLAAFIGLAVMVLFVTALTGYSEFLIFLGALPVIWVYGFFDVMQLLDKKQKGETIEDRSVLEDFEKRRMEGKKSKSVAALLSIMPGAGHLYLGLQKRGIQLMAAFLFSIYILDVLRLGLFLFIIPIIWFYSFFDSLQKAAQYGTGEVEDEPIVSYLINHQKWLGVGLILLGLYYLGTNIFIPMAAPVLEKMLHIDIYHIVYNYVQQAVICLILIGGGIKLLLGKKSNRTAGGGNAK